MLSTSTYQRGFSKVPVILFLLLFSNKAYCQEAQIFLIDMDSILTYSTLNKIRKELRDTFYQKNHQRLLEEVKQFQREVTAYSQHGCCSCTSEQKQLRADKLLVWQEHLREQEAGLLQLDSLFERQFEAFAYEVCAELTKHHMEQHVTMGLVLDANKLGVLSSLGAGYLTEYVIQLLDNTDVYSTRLRALELSLAAQVKQVFQEE